MPADLQVVDLRSVEPPLAESLAGLLSSVWPDSSQTFDERVAGLLHDWKSYAGPAQQFPRAFVVLEEGQPIAHAGLVPREVRAPGHAVTVGALGGVCARPDRRGQGLGVAVVQASFALVDEGVFPYVLFQNYRDYQPFYEKLGARVIDNRIYNSLAEDPQANPFWADVAMVYAGGNDWPEGDLDLGGPGY
ncbi:Acetyltransferase (GNAT) family protein [Posidoniimonas corsicana]|uniref:Acetyltransferase (GNAT) family protein n=1 Tax=Posidoniimonas corsicana TaxID=1938618 RepID=A0A5C5V392_9BACT|nr:GNAT family N-acetyltransferase [Posidoniimonas corsicana]TWT32185.1 Acetyltransferase (GNAT) family protein [Posidoniimonas corsicana]